MIITDVVAPHQAVVEPVAGHPVIEGQGPRLVVGVGLLPGGKG